MMTATAVLVVSLHSLSLPYLPRALSNNYNIMLSCNTVRSRSRLLFLTASRFHSRAHPKPIPEHTVGQAVQMLLNGVEERKIKRAEKWERNASKRAEKGITVSASDVYVKHTESLNAPSCTHHYSLYNQDDGPYRNQDETIELALNLNIDPRKPGQALRGALSLPHGSGKTVRVVVFTRDAQAQQECLEKGALYAGGEEVVNQILEGSIPLDFDRALATPDMQAILGQKLARMLGPRGLMPNAKVGTLVSSPVKLVDSLKEQLAGQVQYRTDKSGIIHLGIGKGSFGPEKLLDNLRSTFNEIYEIKPESFGKGKKKSSSSKNAKYFLKAHLTSTQGKSVRLDLRTVDPTSVFFMGDVME